MKIKLTSVYTHDQDKAPRFYEVVGFAKKADFRQGPFSRLTVASPEEPDGTKPQQELRDNPRRRRISRRSFNGASPRPCSKTDDVKGEDEGMKARDSESRMRQRM